MTIKATGLNGAPAATLTTTNADGTDLDTVSGTAVFSTTPTPIEGTTCITGSGYTIFYTTSASKIIDRIYVYITGTISVDSTLYTAYYASGQVAFTVLISAGNKLRLTTRGDSGVTTIRWSDTTNVPTGAWFRVDIWGDAGTSATNGSARCALFDNPSSTTPRSGSDSASAGSNVNIAGTAATFYTNRISGSANWALDAFGMKDGADATAWSPWPVVGPPVVSHTATSGLIVDFTSSTGVGPFSYALSHVSGPNHLVDVTGPALGVFIVPQDPIGPSVYRVRVTDANAAYTDYDVTIPTLGTVSDSFQVLYMESGTLV